MSLFISCVYFNTFYNAKVAYKDAQRIINLMDYKERSIPSEAKRLLDFSIANSRVVLEKYSKSKYVEEAYYLLASAMFLKDDYISSKEYLNILIENYPNGKYYNEANLRLVSIELKAENLSSVNSIIQNLESNYSLNKYETYLLDAIYAEIHIIEDNIPLAYNSYQDALKNAANDSQRVKIYNKLIQLSEGKKDYENILIFIDGLYKNLSIDSDKKELKLLSLEYNKRLNKYDYLVSEIEEMLNQSLFEDKRLFLLVELSKAYYYLEDYLAAEELIFEILDIYSKKNETAQAYYYLAEINIKNNFNLETIKDLLNKSKGERSNSKYGKMSKEFLKKIGNFETLLYEYEYNDSLIIEELVDGKDSLLFNIAQTYYFDFNQVDSSIIKHSELVSKFSNSKFLPKSLFVLSILDSANQLWKEKLQKDYPGYNLEKSKDIESENSYYNEEYYNALNLLELGFYEEAYPILKNNNLNNDNKESLFYLGYINEIYTLNIEEMIKYYVKYLNESSNEENKNPVKEKLSLYYYMFNKQLKYLSSKNLLSSCLERGGYKDSLILSRDDCIMSNLDFANPGNLDDSLKQEYSEMQILNKPFHKFKKETDFIDDQYRFSYSEDTQLGIQAFNDQEEEKQLELKDVEKYDISINITDYFLLDIEFNQNELQINQLREYITLYDNLRIEEGDNEVDDEVDENTVVPEKSAPFENLEFENMHLDRLNLLKK